MGDYMDIAAMSTVMSGAQLQQKTDISVLGLAMDTTKQTGEAVIEIMEAANALVPEIGLGTTKQTGEAVIEIMEAANALVPEIGLGENFDIRV